MLCFTLLRISHNMGKAFYLPDDSFEAEISLSEAVELVQLPDEQIHLPVFSSEVQAGFPSPAQDYLEESLSLNDILIRNPSATYFLRVRGDSMEDANIYEGALLVIDRLLKYQHNSIVVASVDGEFTVKRLLTQNEKAYLVPEAASKNYKPILVTENCHIWGVVTFIINKASNYVWHR